MVFHARHTMYARLRSQVRQYLPLLTNQQEDQLLCFMLGMGVMVVLMEVL
jgi:hypothetical protein